MPDDAETWDVCRAYNVLYIRQLVYHAKIPRWPLKSKMATKIFNCLAYGHTLMSCGTQIKH